jgi:hypothetical protein
MGIAADVVARRFLSFDGGALLWSRVVPLHLMVVQHFQ